MIPSKVKSLEGLWLFENVVILEVCYSLKEGQFSRVVTLSKGIIIKGCLIQRGVNLCKGSHDEEVWFKLTLQDMKGQVFHLRTFRESNLGNIILFSKAALISVDSILMKCGDPFTNKVYKSYHSKPKWRNNSKRVLCRFWE